MPIHTSQGIYNGLPNALAEAPVGPLPPQFTPYPVQGPQGPPGVAGADGAPGATGPAGGGAPIFTSASQEVWGSVPDNPTLPAGITVAFNDGGNDTTLNIGAAYSGPGPGTGIIAVSDGNNAAPSASTSLVTSSNRPLSRSDRIVSQFTGATGTGGLIYTPPPIDGGGGGQLLMISLVGVPGFEQPADAAWIYLTDIHTATYPGPPTVLTKLYERNPGAMAVPVFTVQTDSTLTVTFADGYHTWTVVVLAATVNRAGSL